MVDGGSQSGQSRRVVTVLFADLVDSTAMAEDLDAELVATIQDRYYSLARATVERHGGAVEKFIGDAVVAVFGAPIAHEDDSVRASRAALELRDGLAELMEDMTKTPPLSSVRLRARIAIHTGEVVVREAVPSRGHALVAGDAVNVAARMQQAAQADEIVVGPMTAALLTTAADMGPVRRVAAKGKAEPLQVRSLIALRADAEAIPRRPDLPLAGREPELRLLLGRYRAVVEDSRPAFVTCIGPAGIGKSRLVRALIETLRDDARILTGRCLPYGESITYWPAAEIVRAAAGVEPRTDRGQVREILESLVAGLDLAPLIVARLETLLGLGEAGAAPAELAWAFRRMLERVAVRQPLLMVLDDLQWAEPPLLDLTEQAVGRAGGRRILVIGVARPEFEERRPGRTLGGSAGTTLRLGPLAASDIERIVLHSGRDVSLLPSRLRRLVAASGGNPLFAEQLATEWSSAGADEFAMPPTLRALLAARLDTLEPAEQWLLESAATIGERFTVEALTALIPAVNPTELTTSLDSLERRDIVVRDERGSGLRGFRFRHLLLRDAAYERTAKRRRARLHEMFADWLEDWAGDRIAEYQEILAHHLESAYRNQLEVGSGDRRVAQRAFEHLDGAVRRALLRQDQPAAARLAQRAAELTDDPTRRLGLLLLMAEAWVDAGRRSEAKVTIDAARTLAVELNDGVGLARIGTIELRDRYHAGEVAEAASAERRIRDAVRQLEGIGDLRGVARALILLYELLWAQGRLVEWQEVGDRALAAATEAGDDYIAERIRGDLLTIAHSGPMSTDDALRLCAPIRSATDLGLIGMEAVGRLEGLIRAMRGEIETGRGMTAEAARLAEEIGSIDLASRAALSRGMVEELAGDPEAAEMHFREALDLQASRGQQYNQPLISERLALALYEQGRFHEAREAVIAAGSIDEASGGVKPIGAIALARVLAAEGETSAAVELADRAIDEARREGFINALTTVLIHASALAHGLGRESDAATFAAEALVLAERKGNVVAAQQARQFIPNR